MATYTNNVPQANQQISATQPTILANFQYLPNMLNVDHNFSNTNTGTDGYHQNIHMLDQSPTPATPITGMQIYSRSKGGISQLFSLDSSGNYSQLTGYSLGTAGWQFIGGLIFQWGTFTTAQASSTIFFANANYTNVYSIVFTPIKPTGGGPDGNVTLALSTFNIAAGKYTGFNVVSFGEASSHVTGYYYMAVGTFSLP